MKDKHLILLGTLLIMLGIIMILFAIFNIKLGKLPGDIYLKKQNIEIYIPITSSLLISVILTIIGNLIFHWISK